MIDLLEMMFVVLATTGCWNLFMASVLHQHFNDRYGRSKQHRRFTISVNSLLNVVSHKRRNSARALQMSCEIKLSLDMDIQVVIDNRPEKGQSNTTLFSKSRLYFAIPRWSTCRCLLRTLTCHGTMAYLSEGLQGWTHLGTYNFDFTISHR